MKRILALFLVLLLLLPAGCEKQPTETASPDTVVEKEETNISDETPSEPVKQPEESPSPEKDSVSEEPEQEPQTSTSSTEEDKPLPTPLEEILEGLKPTPLSPEEEHAERLKECLEAIEVHAKICTILPHLFFFVQIEDTEYSDTPLSSLPDFKKMGFDVGYVGQKHDIDPLTKKHRYYPSLTVELLNPSDETMISFVRTLMEKENFRYVMIIGHNSAFGVYESQQSLESSLRKEGLIE